METLHRLLVQLEHKMPYREAANVKVSEREVAWHIAHSLKVIYQISGAIQHSDPQQYRWQFNKTRSIVFLMNQIPRGKAKSPQSVIPSEDMTPAEFEQEFEKAKAAVLALDHLEAKKFFKHPIFGMLDLKRSKKFIAMHTQHHLKIIDDIIKSIP